MFDFLIKAYEAIAPQLIVVILLVGGIMATLKLLKKGDGGGLKEAAMTAGVFIVAALMLLTFYRFAPNLVNEAGNTLQQGGAVSDVKDIPVP